MDIGDSEEVPSIEETSLINMVLTPASDSAVGGTYGAGSVTAVLMVVSKLS